MITTVTFNEVAIHELSDRRGSQNLKRVNTAGKLATEDRRRSGMMDDKGDDNDGDE